MIPERSEIRMIRPANTRFEKVVKSFNRNWQLYVFVLPALTYFIIIHYIPMYGAQIAFKYFFPTDGFLGSPWAGLDHFKRFFNSYYFWRLLKNTFILNLYLLILFPLPILLALSINEVKNGLFKKWTQTLTYAPHFISIVVVVGMIVTFLDPMTGLVNIALQGLGLGPIPFLTDPDWFRHLYVWSNVWQSVGWGSIIYLAALAGVNPELHEVAKVDGATRLQRIRHINIPSIFPTIIILLILEMGKFMSIGFEKILLMQNELNASTSDVIQTFVYQSGLLQGDYSYAAAVGLFDSAINVVIIVSMNRIARITSKTSLW